MRTQQKPRPAGMPPRGPCLQVSTSGVVQGSRPLCDGTEIDRLDTAVLVSVGQGSRPLCDPIRFIALKSGIGSQLGKGRDPCAT